MPEEHSYEMSDEHKAIMAKLRAKQENKVCLDCTQKNPSWATITYGAFICMDCASHHRSMGVHLTFVQSAVLDTWKPEWVKRMELGGNAKARNFFKQHGLLEGGNTKYSKYETMAAKTYKNQLDKLCETPAPKKAADWTGVPEPAKSPEPAVTESSPPMSPQTPTTPVTPATEPTSNSRPASKSQATASTISGGLGRRPTTGRKKGGLGGGAAVKKVSGGSVKVTTGPVPDEPKPEPKTPVSTSSAKASTADGKPDYSGFGSGGATTEEKRTSYAHLSTDKGNYSKAGPDYGGIGSTCGAVDNGRAAVDDSGADLSEFAWKVGDKVAQQKQALQGTMDSIGNSVKNFLDDL
eukprot:NODE_1503_length_1315_cov_64.623737_g1490_i0.p1 GENE.NODE_1503_length_1315_cov_64.623737_g1490_i0~~NODE_1503_length_1315_cov_64.623737_g1490_i0.p1  ORF type:complete len:371 (-),score=77.65 NODE_1503_length_1315_cov_64.623737_g1490_i0:202-1254(-)